MISLIIADDHTLFRQGLRQLLEINGGFNVLAEAETGQKAIALTREHGPDVILLDIQMPDLTGVEATRSIIQENPAAKILILTMYPQDHHIAAAIKAGAKGYLLKTCEEQTLFNAIEAIYHGEGWLDSAVAPSVLSLLAESNSGTNNKLTEQELETLRYVAQGADNQTIAEKMHITTGTVANRLRVIFTKLGVKNRTEAALFALRQGWASLNDD
jgi:DNA-binding NarL/FixJ family response regulator